MKEILISSGVLIPVIILLRQLFRSKVSQRLVYGAWLLVALRLLIPVQLGQSEYSVTSLTEKIETQSQPIQQVQAALQEPVAGPSRAELYEQLLNDYVQQSTAPATPEIREQIEIQVEKQVTAPTLSEILTAAWIGGMGIMAIWLLSTNILFLRRAKKGAVPFTECNTPVPVRISPNVPTPCLVGLFRPVIYLTTASTESPQSLNHVLTHELSHLRHWDHIWSLVRCVCLCIYWFDPLVWVAAILSKRDCELACDEGALKKLGDGERIPYGKTLLHIVTHSNSPAHLLETATAMNETKKQLKERVNYIVKKPRNLLIAAISLILIAALTAGCAFMGSKPTEPPATHSPSAEPTVTQSQPTDTKPTVPAPTDPLPTEPAVTVPPVTEAPPELEPTIAEELIRLYQLYQTVRICCDYEYVYQDMSEFLTDAQKEERYFDFQYRITCCHSADEVRAHIDRTLGPSLVTRGYPDDRLFTDDQSNLYLIVTPTGSGGYWNIEEIHYTDTETLAYACYGYDTYEYSEAFLIEHTDDGSIIKQSYQFMDPLYSSDSGNTEQAAELTEDDLAGLYAKLKKAEENAN